MTFYTQINNVGFLWHALLKIPARCFFLSLLLRVHLYNIYSPTWLIVIVSSQAQISLGAINSRCSLSHGFVYWSKKWNRYHMCKRCATAINKRFSERVLQSTSADLRHPVIEQYWLLSALCAQCKVSVIFLKEIDESPFSISSKRSLWNSSCLILYPISMFRIKTLSKDHYWFSICSQNGKIKTFHFVNARKTIGFWTNCTPVPGPIPTRHRCQNFISQEQTCERVIRGHSQSGTYWRRRRFRCSNYRRKQISGH